MLVYGNVLLLSTLSNKFRMQVPTPKMLFAMQRKTWPITHERPLNTSLVAAPTAGTK